MWSPFRFCWPSQQDDVCYPRQPNLCNSSTVLNFFLHVIHITHMMLHTIFCFHILPNGAWVRFYALKCYYICTWDVIHNIYFQVTMHASPTLSSILLQGWSALMSWGCCKVDEIDCSCMIELCRSILIKRWVGVVKLAFWAKITHWNCEIHRHSMKTVLNL